MSTLLAAVSLPGNALNLPDVENVEATFELSIWMKNLISTISFLLLVHVHSRWNDWSPPPGLPGAICSEMFCSHCCVNKLQAPSSAASLTCSFLIGSVRQLCLHFVPMLAPDAAQTAILGPHAALHPALLSVGCAHSAAMKCTAFLFKHVCV